MKGAILRMVAALMLILVSGCSSLVRNSSSRAWSQTAAQEHDEQSLNANQPNYDAAFHPFGAP